MVCARDCSRCLWNNKLTDGNIVRVNEQRMVAIIHVEDKISLKSSALKLFADALPGLRMIRNQIVGIFGIGVNSPRGPWNGKYFQKKEDR